MARCMHMYLNSRAFLNLWSAESSICFSQTVMLLNRGYLLVSMHNTQCGRVVNKSLFRFALSSSCVVYQIKLTFLFCILSFFFIRVLLLNRLKQKRHYWLLANPGECMQVLLYLYHYLLAQFSNFRCTYKSIFYKKLSIYGGTQNSVDICINHHMLLCLMSCGLVFDLVNSSCPPFLLHVDILDIWNCFLAATYIPIDRHLELFFCVFRLLNWNEKKSIKCWRLSGSSARTRVVVKCPPLLRGLMNSQSIVATCMKECT
jgi:hypothetical protein